MGDHGEIAVKVVDNKHDDPKAINETPNLCQ